MSLQSTADLKLVTAVDTDTAALANLISMCRIAGIIPENQHKTIAQQLIEHGIVDEASLYNSIVCIPPAINLFAIMADGQVYTLMVHLNL